jgi:hypothetical protein
VRTPVLCSEFVFDKVQCSEQRLSARAFLQLGCSLAWGTILAVAVAIFLAQRLSVVPEVLSELDIGVDLVK